MKKILGLDLGTTSIGWAYVHEAENSDEVSKIIRLGVRVNPLTSDENKNFTEGKSITTNADRTLKRHSRRNRDRYQMRRDKLIQVFLENKWISSKGELVEDKTPLHEIYKIRANAVKNKISLKDFARVLLMINKKRGYKSSRKAKNQDEDGQLIDGMELAIYLSEKNLTPGQYSYNLVKKGKKIISSFYRSDLINEFDKIWEKQQYYYPDILTKEFKEQIKGKSKTITTKTFLGKYSIYTAKNEGAGKRIQAFKWRSDAVKEALDIEQVAFVLSEINGNIANSSGYLGEISDRSKILHFEKLTVGEYQYKQLMEKSYVRLKNQIFYRQDYMDEFDSIWDTQSKYYSVLTNELKYKIRNKIIFYQRPLKSQKGLIGFCEFESKQIDKMVDGQKRKITIGSKVIPRSSPLFQEFKIWQILNNIRINNGKDEYKFSLEEKEKAFELLNIREKISAKELLKKLYGKEGSNYKINFKDIEGNKTNAAFLKAYEKMLEYEGNEINLTKLNPEKVKDILISFFNSVGINKEILTFDSELRGKDFIRQKSYELWHLLYSYEGDNSKSGNEKLLKALKDKFGFEKEFAQILANLSLIQDYGNLSAKAIRKIIPFLKENTYDIACAEAGYNHSSSLTAEENSKRELKDYLEILPKNSLRNPVVEKILNQMVHVINNIIDDPNMGKPDEIRIELSRELKKNAKERESMTREISKATKLNESIKNKLHEAPFNIKNPTRNDVIRYKLYKELESNNYHTFYTNRYVPMEKLFSNEIDIEHIIPKALIFDDSFSNKTLAFRDVNLKKDKQTAIDFIEAEYGEKDKEIYIQRITSLYDSKNISKAKFLKLTKKASEIGEGFIERDLRDSQYIAKKAKNLLFEVCRDVTSTTGKITAKLREDWDLINVMKELNIEKYRRLGLTKIIERKNGNKVEQIIDWTKRNDHRHHAMDALTVAFTKLGHIQYLNNLNAKSDKGSSIYGLKNNLTYIENNKRKFISPLQNFRQEAKKHLESILISRKAKNKVVTRNINKIKLKGKNNYLKKVELTPRGQLHKETIYGAMSRYKTKFETVGGKFNEELIQTVANKKYRDALLNRLHDFNDNPKKAFTGKNSLLKVPILLQNGKEVPLKVKTVNLVKEYTIRKEVNPDLKIEKVIDVGIRNILLKRLEEYENNKKLAFSNLEQNPIWLNEKRGIAIKRVTITGVANAEAIHSKKDHHGNIILNEEGIGQAVDFVSTGNNHHVAVYQDNKGNLQEKVVSFFEAVHRVNEELPIVDKLYKSEEGWKFLFTMKQNEYFVFPSGDFDPNEIDLMDKANYALISPHLFRVQKFTFKDYFFRHHLETTVDNNKSMINITWKRIGLKGVLGIKKVRINHLGYIVEVGEY